MGKFKDWMESTYEPETLADIVKHGCSAGWPGMTYYTETVALYGRHEEEIWDALHRGSRGVWVRYPPGFRRVLQRS